MNDNLSLSEKIKERYRSMYTGVFYKRYILGLWCAADGLIYDMFDKAKHVVGQIKESFYPKHYVSCDYGTQNATVFLLWQRGESGTWYCIKEYYYSGRDEHKQKTDIQYVEDLKEFLDGIKPEAVIVDPSAASFIAQLKQSGFRVKKAKNEVLDGIRFVGTQLNLGKIRFLESCENTIKEFGSYTWDEKAVDRGEDKPVKEYDHCITGDTLIDTVKGQIPIKELVGKKGKVYCYDLKKKRKTISSFYNVRMTQRDARIFKIELEDGRCFNSTKDHLILTKRGWIKTHDLNRYDEILDIKSKK